MTQHKIGARVQFHGDTFGDFGTVADHADGKYRVNWDDGDQDANETWFLPGELIDVDKAPPATGGRRG
jgi:hypothetical protein